MKQQKQGFRLPGFIQRLIRPAVPLLTGIIIIVSCENDIEKINAITREVNLPVQSGYNVEIIYTDSGKLEGKIFAPELHKYASKDNPYMEFPKGIKVVFCNDEGIPESFINANYAKYYQKKELWEARGDVVAKNEKEGNELNTEILFWDQKAQLVYSNVFSKITKGGDTFYGERGFESNQKITKWKLRESKGVVNLKDEPEN